MSEALDRIKAHYDGLGLREIQVPEWKMSFFVTPVTPTERTRIYKGSNGDSDYGVIVNALIVKAQDKDGNKLFTLADKNDLMLKSDSTVCIRIFGEIINGPSPSVEELKNS